MIKRLLLGCISILFTLNIVSCGSYDKTTHLEEEILVYTTYSEDIMEFISKTFTEETGINIEYEIVQTDLEESIANNPEVDFILGGDIATYEDLSQQQKLKSYKTSWFDEMNESDRQENGDWYAVAKDMILLVYNNQNLLPQNAPKSWAQLSSSTYRDKIVIENTENEYIKVILSSVMYQYNKNNQETLELEYFQDLKNNIAKFTNSKEDLFESLRTKETPIGICTLSDYIKYATEGDSMVIVKPEEGILSITQGAAILKNSKNPNAAELFMEFVAGPRIQIELSKNNNVVPTHPEVMKYGADWMKSLADLTPMDIEWEVVQSNKNSWISIFNSLEKEEIKNNTSTKNQTNKKNTQKNNVTEVQQTIQSEVQQPFQDERLSGEENDTPEVE